ncbi:MAG: hypothetical protein K2K73_01645 [Ureaplasma sp.]|nr:hypothetical protein [Ureaplasma sp.]
MYYITAVYDHETNKTDIFHKAKLKIIPSVSNNIMTLFFEFYLFADFSIPPNSLIIDFDSNFGKFENIALNINVEKSWNFNRYYEANLTFNIEDCKELTNKIHKKTKLDFYPKFRVDAKAFNDAKLSAEDNNVNWFISKLALLSEKELLKETYYYSNIYSLHDVCINNIDTKEINKPSVIVPIFNKELNYNSWTNLYDFIHLVSIKNEKLNIDWLKLNVDYYLNEIDDNKKIFTYNFKRDININDNSNNNKNDNQKTTNFSSELNPLYTNFNYEKKEIIKSDKTNGYEGIFIPFKAKGTIQLALKINSIIYYQNFSFKLNENLFGNNGKYKINLKSYD